MQVISFSLTSSFFLLTRTAGLLSYHKHSRRRNIVCQFCDFAYFLHQEEKNRKA